VRNERIGNPPLRAGLLSSPSPLRERAGVRAEAAETAAPGFPAPPLTLPSPRRGEGFPDFPRRENLTALPP